MLYCPGDDERTRRRITWSLHRLRPDVVISGGAPGVDTLAAEVAAALGYSAEEGTLVILRPEVERWHPKGYKERNQKIASMCTHLLRLYCTHSTTYGSGWTYDLAERMQKPVVRECVCVR